MFMIRSISADFVKKDPQRTKPVHNVKVKQIRTIYDDVDNVQ